jgi:hypothetical protein
MMSNATKKEQYSFFYRNGLSLVLLLLLLFSLAGQFITGWHEFNNFLQDEGQPEIRWKEYFFSGHFIQATFENWESEFLQMAMYVLFTIWLRQKGSAESKKLRGEGEEEVDREPVPHKDAPWPVKKGGIWLRLYSNSLSIAFALLFIISFVFHLYGSLKDFNQEELIQGRSPVGVAEYLAQARFWFESFQNWQSEFLAVFSIVVLTIWFRQKGSAQSKPVDSPYGKTGEE